MQKIDYKTFLPLMILLTVNAYCEQSYSPRSGQSYPEHVYWGDTHLHSNLSIDANFNGNKKLTPEDAYRFAMGKTIRAHNNMQARLGRPLDFLVIADHGFNLGLPDSLYNANQALLGTPSGKRLYQKFTALADTDIVKRGKFVFDQTYLKNPVAEKEYTQKIWQRVASTADRYSLKVSTISRVVMPWP